MRIRIAKPLEGRLAAAAFLAGGVTVAREAPALWAEIDRLTVALRSAFAGVPPSAVEALGPARALYRAAGVDPTRRRPASEALFRRVVKGKDLYRINGAVDCSNFCSLSFLLPVGLYDRRKIRGDEVAIRLGAEGEGYEGHGKDRVNLGGHILLADADGPFGHPSADSVRTGVSEETRELLWIILAPADYDPGRLAEHARFSRSWLESVCGGTTVPVEG